jgi:POT family proton-dependent oligopeptide transporter
MLNRSRSNSPLVISKKSPSSGGSNIGSNSKHRLGGGVLPLSRRVHSGNSISNINISSIHQPLPQSIANNTDTTMPSLPSSSSFSANNFFQSQLQQVSIGFRSLSTAPPELYKAYILKFLDSYAYFSFSLIFTLFLSQDFGMSDVEAGTIYGAWGALITVFGLFTGTIIDRLGVAKCLRIGFILSFITRIMLFTCTSKNVLLFCTLVSLPLANCLGIPVLTIGLRRYTNNENRGFAFGLFYVVMNVGALIAGPLVDILTRHFNNYGGSGSSEEEGANDVAGEYEDATTATEAWTMTTNRGIILSGVIANFFAVFVAFSVREIKVDSNAHVSSAIASDDMDDGSIVDGDGIMADPPSNSKTKTVSNFQPIQGASYNILFDTIKTPNFRRFLLVVLLTLNVRMIFRHLDGTLPKYMIREFGENTPKGAVYSINPALIIIMVPIITAATSSADPLVMIHYGTYISALSVFFLVLSTSVPACVMFVITLSIGEAIWSPRLYDYTTTVAPEGREGTYMALSSAPLFLAKLPVGVISGVLLQKYCPENLEEGEERHSKTMWLIIGLMSISSPLLITFFWSYISGGERGAGHSNAATRISNGERVMRDDDDMYFQNDDDESYQHRPLATKLSLPRVRGGDRSLSSSPVGTLT